MHNIFSCLTDMTVERFLQDYWQQKPLFIPGAFTDFRSPISADELAGLAMEEFVESRIVLTDGWQLRHGPFLEEDFHGLPESPWTLLVQGVDQLVPELSALIKAFAFLPSWRLDDIMVSFANDGGGVGPHFDQYDVFLLQAQGRRRWQIGQVCDADSACIENLELAILKDFQYSKEHVLTPGDILYLPPKVAHWGTAMGESMTFSVGFRAPNAADIVGAYAAYCLEEMGQQGLGQSPRYSDEGRLNSRDSSRIGMDTITAVRTLLLEAVDKPQVIATWFGRYMTTPRYEMVASDREIVDVKTSDNNGEQQLQKSAGSRFAYYSFDGQRGIESQSGNGREVLLFANGNHWAVSEGFAQAICARDSFCNKTLKKIVATQADALALEALKALDILEAI